jgi:uncharacterized protein (TIGR02145 family)
MKIMKNKGKIFYQLLLITALVLIFSGGCTKVNTDPATIQLNMTDQDGNTYKTIVIGTQTWMAENLKTTKFNDNTAIANVSDNALWIGLTTAGYCWYKNDEAVNKDVYGALYNWYAVETGKLCSAGWHVPTDADYDTLELHLGIPASQVDLWGSRGTDQGAQMKSVTGWAVGENGTNTSGFTALPGGYRYAADGSFYSVGSMSYWWSSTEDRLDTSWYRRLDGGTSDIYKAATSKAAGKYVRCIMD